MSTLSRMAIKVAHDCAGGSPSVRMIFASRHGELHRSTEIIGDMVAGRPVSPAAFSLSVLNAAAGVFGTARTDRAPASAISAGAETLGYALLEAHAQRAEDDTTPVLLVYADEPPASVYEADLAADAPAGALALLFAPEADPLGETTDRTTDAGTTRLTCSLSASGATPATASTPAQPDTAAPSHAIPLFASQCEALLHTLSAGAPASWRGPTHTWIWRCDVPAH